MINERLEAEKFLRGEGLHKDIEYRICFLLAKYFYQQGKHTVLDIRNSLKEWAKENKFYIDASMNTIAKRVIDGENTFNGDYPVYVSKADVGIIRDRFDTYPERIHALALLLYAKANANKRGEFKISQRTLGYWIGVTNGTRLKYRMDMAEQLQYIKLAECGAIDSWYQKYSVHQVNTYKILVPYDNIGEYELIDNDIGRLYDLIFNGVDANTEEWYDIPGYNNNYQISNYKRVRVKERIVNGRKYPGRILKQTKEWQAIYVKLRDDEGQHKVSIESLYQAAC